MDSASPSKGGGEGWTPRCHLFISDSGRSHPTHHSLAHVPQPGSRALQVWLWHRRRESLPALGKNPVHAQPVTAFPQMPGHTGCSQTLEGPAWPSALGCGRGPRAGQLGRVGTGDSSLGRAPGGRPLQMERSGWDHSTQARAARGGPGTQPAAHSAAGSVAPAQRTSSAQRPQGPGRIRVAAGWKPSVTDALPSLGTGQGGNVLRSLPGKRKSGRRIKLRSHRPNLLLFLQKLYLRLIHVKKSVFLPFLSMLHPQPVGPG